ncbi:unnamed protein product [Effrenium voratum]|uniref:Uncharacterized protein n=1 Tax=Effrenium voratum TaxID=2562239 RepID=A0AA36I9G3_9DINO|nr:unnamed protein product [Effrenium voratum]
MSNGRELLPGLSSGQLQEPQEPQEPVTEPVLPTVPVLTVPSVPTATLINTTRQRIDQARAERAQREASRQANPSQNNPSSASPSLVHSAPSRLRASREAQVQTYKTELKAGAESDFLVLRTPQPAQVDASTAVEPPEEPQLKHGCFSCGQSCQRLLWVPKGINLRMNSTHILDTALRQWNLPSPNLLIHIRSGFAHPKHMVSIEVVRSLSPNLSSNQKLLQQLRMFWETIHMEDSFDDALRTLQEESERSDTARWKAPLQGLSHVLHADLVELLTSIINTMVAANCWILVHGAPSGGLALLEQLTDLPQQPVVLVVDSPNARRYWDVEDYKSHLKVWNATVEATIRESLTQGQQMLEKLRREAKPIGVACKTVHLDKGFWHSESWEQQKPSSAGAENVRWNQWPFRSGTHYILTEDEHFEELQLNELAPQGAIVMGGDAHALKQLIRGLKLGQPIIVLANTGRAAQWFTAIHQESLSRLTQDHEEDKKSVQRRGQSTQQLRYGGGLGHPADAKLMEYLFLRFRPKGECSEADLAELALLYQRKALKISRLCVVLNPLDAEDHNGHRQNSDVAACISHASFMPTTDAADQANVDSVKAAWEFHSQLTKLASKEKIMFDALAWLMAVFLLLVQAAAWIQQLGSQDATIKSIVKVLQTYVADTGSAQLTPFINAIPKTTDWLVELSAMMPFIFPVVSAICLALVAIWLRFRFAQRYGRAAGAAVRLEGEISRFRARAGEYSLSAVQICAGMKVPTGRHARELASRNLFDQRVEQIISEISKVLPFPKSPNLEQKAGTWRPHARVTPSDPEDFQEYDFVSEHCMCMSIDEYVVWRLLPFLEEMEEEVAWLGRWLQCVELLAVALLIASTLLAAFRMPFPAAMLIAAVPVVMLLQRHYALNARLNAANLAVEDLKCCWQHWSSLEPYPRRWETTKARLVDCTEGAKLKLVNAATACNASSKTS